MIRAGAGDTSALQGPDAALLRAVVDAIPARVTIVGNDHRYLYVNREFLEFMGRDAAEVIGRHVSEVLGKSAYEALAPLRARVQAGETVRREGWLDYGGRQPRFVQQIFTPYRSGGNDIEGYLVFARDLTELKSRERELAEQVAALQASEASNAAVIASSLDCIIVLDPTGAIVEFNPAAETAFGYRRAAVLGRLVTELVVAPGRRSEVEAALAEYRERGSSALLGRRMEAEAMRANGEAFPIELTATELKLPTRTLIAAHLRDLTAAKAAEAEIEHHRNRLHQVEKLSAMGSLLAGVAHELNNPLAILLAQATLLQAKAETPELKARADKIHAAAARAGRIVKSFLAMARQKPPERHALELKEVIEAALDMTAYGRRSAGIELAVSLEPEPMPLQGDRDMLGQVVANLLINASQALADMPGSRQVWLSARRVDGSAELSVADNGPGVSAEIAERIFDPYFTTKPLGIGTGIGLTISRNTVEAHGGRLEVGKRPGGGALFRVTLPLMRAAEQERAQAEPGQPNALSVLVVDDEPDLAASMAEMVQSLGHRAVVASGGEDAFERARAGSFDLVLADLRMPGLGGAALQRKLRDAKLRRPPAFVLTTGDAIASADLAATAGGEYVLLEKPFTAAELRTALDQAFVLAAAGA